MARVKALGACSPQCPRPRGAGQQAPWPHLRSGRPRSWHPYEHASTVVSGGLQHDAPTNDAPLLAPSHPDRRARSRGHPRLVSIPVAQRAAESQHPHVLVHQDGLTRARHSGGFDSEPAATDLRQRCRGAGAAPPSEQQRRSAKRGSSGQSHRAAAERRCLLTSQRGGSRPEGRCRRP